METGVIVRDFEGFFGEQRTRLSAALWLMTRDRHEAEELAQEAFVRVWERWDRVGELDDAEGYLFRTAMNLFRNRRRRAVLAAKKVFQPAARRDEISDVEHRDVVVRALAKLTPRQRAAIVLTTVLDMTSEEAGEALGIRPSTVRVLTSRAREQLKGSIGDDHA